MKALEPFFNVLLQNWPGITCLLGFYVLFKIFASPTFKGWFGEKMVLRGLRKLDPAQYRVFHDLYLPHPSEQGTTQIDHVVVSPFGIFVIETKNYRGWIFGSAKQAQWTQQIFRKKHKFQNPLHQNKLHVKALMQFLNLPEDHFHSVVLFIGDTEFKTEMPDNVLNGGLTRWIQSRSEPRIIAFTVDRAVSQLSELDRTTNRRSASREHLKALKMRHESL
jgi:restriction system protein